MATKSFPVVVNTSLEDGLNRRAEFIVKSFKAEIYPLLLKFGLLDDNHIRKYLACDTTEAIYSDALKENPSTIYALKQQAFVEELKEDPKQRIDVWSIFRDFRSEVKSPEEDGFIFRPIPGSNHHNRFVVLKALSVKNLCFSIDREFLKEISIVKPTDEQIELYNMVKDFCEAYNNNNFYKKRCVTNLFSSNANGIFPNIHNILGLNWIYQIKEG